MIRAVFFDFDGTLYDRDAAIVRMAEEQFDTFRSELSVEKSVFVEYVIAMDGHGHDRTPRLHHALAHILGFDDSLAERLEDCFRSRYPTYCRISEDDRNTLVSLKAAGAKLGLITNGPTIWQSRKIDSMGVAPLFDTILISEREGVEKPDPQIFHRALERCGVSARDSMFVGDHPVVDIEGARNAGLIPVWKQMPYWSAPDDVARIDQLSEILALVT
jgi:putative hydrolase of the HAD superfamily